MITRKKRNETEQTKEIIKLWGIDFDFNELSEMYHEERYDEIRKYFEEKDFENIEDNEYFFSIRSNKNRNIAIGFQRDRVLISDEDREGESMLLYL